MRRICPGEDRRLGRPCRVMASNPPEVRYQACWAPHWGQLTLVETSARNWNPQSQP
jgi:hypothetical protein